VDPEGVSWQDFGTYMHELGHCVEGVLSSYEMPYQLMWGVPATAFSEAFAFTFQDLSRAVLGQEAPRDTDVETLQRVWEAFEIAGPSLVEMRLFRWLYQNPDATSQQIHEAAQRIGDEVWAQFHAPVFGANGYGLMSVYSHMLWCRFYLAEYPLGYIIAYQVRRHLRGRPDLADEITRMCRQGDIYPDAWMRNATGEKVSVEPMLTDAAAALDRMGIGA
jgi:oligoendopeptidase F